MRANCDSPVSEIASMPTVRRAAIPARMPWTKYDRVAAASPTLYSIGENLASCGAKTAVYNLLNQHKTRGGGQDLQTTIPTIPIRTSASGARVPQPRFKPLTVFPSILRTLQ